MVRAGPLLLLFIVVVALTAGATALAAKYRPETAPYIAAGGLALGLGLVVLMAGEIGHAARMVLNGGRRR